MPSSTKAALLTGEIVTEIQPSEALADAARPNMPTAIPRFHLYEQTKADVQSDFKKSMDFANRIRSSQQEQQRNVVFLDPIKCEQQRQAGGDSFMKRANSNPKHKALGLDFS